MNAPWTRELERSPSPQPIADALDGVLGHAEIERVNRQVKAFVVERPVFAVLMALTAGYAIGRLFSRAS
jgi:hypothetical protein